MSNSAFGGTWEEFEREHFTPEEIAASDLRVALIGEMIKARQEQGMTQQDVAAASGIKQPVISRMEREVNDPRLDTVLRFLAPLGKTLAIVPIQGR